MTTFGIGGAPWNSPLERIDLGMEHPTRAGLVLVEAHVTADRIDAATVTTGLSHRGAEKLFEVRDYRQGLALADRHEWQASFAGELAYALLVEEALGIVVTERSSLLRTLTAEHSRAHGLLACLAWLADDDIRPVISHLREELRTHLAVWTGNRVHPMLVRIGGMAADVDDDWCDREAELASDILLVGTHLRALLAERSDLRGIGVLTADDIASLGLTGPTARASGVAGDVRRDAPYAAYPLLPRTLPAPREGGDVAARFEAMLDDLRVAAALMIDALARLRDTPGEISTHLPKILRMPEGEWLRCVEGLFGQAGIRIVSRGEKTPWRVFLRTAGLTQVMALETALVGARVDASAAIAASLPWTIGDVDK